MGIKKASLTEICYFIHNNKVENLSDTLILHKGYGYVYADHLYGEVYLVAVVKERLALTYASADDIKANKYIGEIVDFSVLRKNWYKCFKIDGHLNPPVFFKGVGVTGVSDPDAMSMLKSYNVKSFIDWKKDIIRADFDYTN
jgi:hypothetical protein